MGIVAAIATILCMIATAVSKVENQPQLSRSLLAMTCATSMDWNLNKTSS
jgi:hypothetical protein